MSLFGAPAFFALMVSVSVVGVENDEETLTKNIEEWGFFLFMMSLIMLQSGFLVAYHYFENNRVVMAWQMVNVLGFLPLLRSGYFFYQVLKSKGLLNEKQA